MRECRISRKNGCTLIAVGSSPKWLTSTVSCMLSAACGGGSSDSTRSDTSANDDGINKQTSGVVDGIDDDIVVVEAPAT